MTSNKKRDQIIVIVAIILAVSAAITIGATGYYLSRVQGIPSVERIQGIPSVERVPGIPSVGRTMSTTQLDADLLSCVGSTPYLTAEQENCLEVYKAGLLQVSTELSSQ